MSTLIHITQTPINLPQVQQALYALNQPHQAPFGAIVTFTGMVRDFNVTGTVTGLHLEHYPGMAEKQLEQIAQQAIAHHHLGHVTIVHRIGQMVAADPIVFVGIASAHRQNGFDAVADMMNQLKSVVPIWKQELTPSGPQWVAPAAVSSVP